MLRKLYGYRISGQFLEVPTLTGKKVLSHLPLLNYASVSVPEAHGLAAAAGRRPYQIRVLNGSYTEFKQHDTVTMRIDLRRESSDDVYAGISKRTRRYLKDLERHDFNVESGKDKAFASNFYSVFQDVMHRLGTPAFPLRLFELLPAYVDTRFYLAYFQQQLAAAAVVIYDEDIAWVPWSGTLSTFLEHRPGLGMYWSAIKDAHGAGKGIFDYGRSGYEAGTYEFKLRWGALPVKIDILSDSVQKPYEKYEAASSIWKKLPRLVTDAVGPALCKYLPDL